jgi:dTMP kinase
MQGFFVTFEGGEGSGKTTQLKALLGHLRSVGRDVVETRDPGGTAIGNQIRGLLLDGENARMDSLTELLLYEASRAQLVQEVVQPALAAGRILLCDRFTDSTVAYQGYGRGLDLDLIERLNASATRGIRPDLTFFLDLDPVVGLERVKRRLTPSRASRDRLEDEALAFHERVRQGFRALAATEPERVIALDAVQSLSELAAEIRRRVDARLGPTEAAPGIRRRSD